ncbi:unnamed protein product [Gemmata massiliana]|uniref:TIGR02996 domain-containing protein n=1 Tax=Gemmata massiliana TaxID=1210884 RepID=A0A6P2DKE3_9BACT|nr:TIGR02996 domain-containing protein [Gemmata massiliana]VTS01038.1 unnamed protein product [Gemmata massiliana]
MTEREAFVRKICEAPADDTARLVYADWLDEYGDEADHTRAKFIRQRYPAAVIGLSRQPKPAARPWATYARALFAGVVPRAWATWLVPSPGSPVWNRWWKNRTWSEMCRKGWS